MRHKQKKETLEVIVQRMTNDADGSYLADLIKIADAIKTKDCYAQLEVFQNIKWLYGYENEILKVLENIKFMLEKKSHSSECSVSSTKSSSAVALPIHRAGIPSLVQQL